MLEKLFPNNEALAERLIRMVLGAGLLSLAFVGPHTPWGWAGLLPLVTGAVGSCPAYTLFGFSTKRSPAPAR